MNEIAPLVTLDPARLSGAPCFAGTRVPVQALFDYLTDGRRLSDFLKDFPEISETTAVGVLKASSAALVLDAVERESYRASEDELAAVDEALAQSARGERASAAEVAAAFALFRR